MSENLAMFFPVPLVTSFLLALQLTVLRDLCPCWPPATTTVSSRFVVGPNCSGPTNIPLFSFGTPAKPLPSDHIPTTVISSLTFFGLKTKSTFLPLGMPTYYAVSHLCQRLTWLS